MPSLVRVAAKRRINNKRLIKPILTKIFDTTRGHKDLVGQNACIELRFKLVVERKHFWLVLIFHVFPMSHIPQRIHNCPKIILQSYEKHIAKVSLGIRGPLKIALMCEMYA